jgi:hypothetical protein
VVRFNVAHQTSAPWYGFRADLAIAAGGAILAPEGDFGWLLPACLGLPD